MGFGVITSTRRHSLDGRKSPEPMILSAPKRSCVSLQRQSEDFYTMLKEAVYMTADSLIGKPEACKCDPEGKTHYEIVHDAAFNRAIDIVRQHEAERPHLINPEKSLPVPSCKRMPGPTPRSSPNLPSRSTAFFSPRRTPRPCALPLRRLPAQLLTALAMTSKER